jgi:XTP/dITP diphosphohydrolase
MGVRLLLASNNVGKLRELAELLAGLPIELVPPADLGLSLEIAETGATFAENARLKARAFARASGLPAVADDSGLEIAALGDWPGVHSARVAGPGADDARRRELVLARLNAVPDASRAARFVAAVALADGDRILAEAEGILGGAIATMPRGAGGFGYDPIFIPTGLDRTLAELTAAEKNNLSHRGRAIRKLLPQLRALLGG